MPDTVTVREKDPVQRAESARTSCLAEPETVITLSIDFTTTNVRATMIVPIIRGRKDVHNKKRYE